MLKADTPLVSNAVVAVRELITMHAIDQGGRLPSETDLAGRIGVSRPVLRQALAVLKDEGVIESRRGSGTYACGSLPTASTYGKPETLADLEDCLRFRMIVEGAAAAEAARRADKAAIDDIRATVMAMENGPSRDSAVAETDMAFHSAVARATRSRYHAMTLEFLMPHILFGLRLGRQLHSVPPDITSRRVASEHRAIFQAIESGDGALAAETMREHLSAGLARIFGKRSW